MATHEVADVQEMLVGMVCESPEGSGSVPALQDDPFQVSARPAPTPPGFVAPTALHELPEEQETEPSHE
jgi:hypothetical protein